MKTFCFFMLLPAFFVPAAHAADMRAAIAPSPEYQGEGSEFIISWDSLAGKWYNVEAATQLDGDWSTLNPDPIVAQSGEATYRDQTTSPVRFYRVRKLDTEPPEVVHLNPGDGAIAVGRQEPLTVELWDEAGIAWESIAFSVASGPSIGVGDPRLSFTDNVLIYVPGSGEYHGDYGEAVAVTLSVSDKHGYRLENYTWTFRLELEAVLASNVVLIDEVSALTLLSIADDTYTFSYSGDGPGLSLGDILVSTYPGNPYKRRALDIADHPESHTVDILTEAVPLAELFEQGSVRMRQLVVEEPATAPSGARRPHALLLEPGKEYRRDFSGTVIDDDGISVEVTSGYVEFVPEVTVGADFNGLRLTSFDCEVKGTVNLKAVVKASADRGGTYEPPPTKICSVRRIPVQIIWGFPVWEEIVLEFWVGFTAQTDLEGWVQAGFESSSSLSIGAKLRDGEWTKYITPKHNFQPLYPDWQIGGNVTLQAYVEPRLVVYLESIAGPCLNIKPYLQLDGTFQLNPRMYDWALNAGITADLGIVVRGWDDKWGELPSWNLLDYKTDRPLASGKYPPGWDRPTRWYVDDSVSSSGVGSSWRTAFKTIQEGIDAASDGDEIIVAEGIYFENIHFGGKNITLRSTDPLDRSVVSRTVVDGNYLDAVVRFAGTESRECVLSGFSIRNGKYCGIWGGGYPTPALATIQNNMIRSNWWGGISWCNGTIQNNVISGNDSEHGGGIDSCDGVIQNNVICGNRAGLADGGGGLRRCHGIIRNNTICQNRSYWPASGIEQCNGTIENCIIWGNKIGYNLHPSQIASSTTPSHCLIEGWAEGGDNIDGDPCFAAPGRWDDNGTPDNWMDDVWVDGDYHLRSNSPCIDAGKNASWMWNAVDLDGNPRIINGRVDMGSYEYKL
ncbi:MAG: choice-of-anchor Q domain-containing protein [bacterium]|nr:choice-of-anchor Q domain-containing protein [bacterium]